MKITHHSQNAAEDINPDETMAIISITGLKEIRALKKGWGARLDLEFNDINNMTQEEASESGVKLFDEEIARKLADFIFTLPAGINHIVIHCRQGLSRSATIAKVLCEEVYNEPFPEDWPYLNPLVYTIFRKTILEYKDKGLK